jgi:hypothetical protein
MCYPLWALFRFPQKSPWEKSIGATLFFLKKIEDFLNLKPTRPDRFSLILNETRHNLPFLSVFFIKFGVNCLKTHAPMGRQ